MIYRIELRYWPIQCQYDVTGWSDISSAWGMIILQIIKIDHWPSSNIQTYKWFDRQIVESHIKHTYTILSLMNTDKFNTAQTPWKNSGVSQNM